MGSQYELDVCFQYIMFKYSASNIYRVLHYIEDKNVAYSTTRITADMLAVCGSLRLNSYIL